MQQPSMPVSAPQHPSHVTVLMGAMHNPVVAPATVHISVPEHIIAPVPASVRTAPWLEFNISEKFSHVTQLVHNLKCLPSVA
jgi:hypothetical protein